MKRLLKIVAVVAVAVTAGFIAYNAQSDELQLSDLAMDNVEAIARGESSGGSYHCYYGSQNSYGRFEPRCSPCLSYQHIDVTRSGRCGN